MTTRYIGSGPYCYANCMAMALADGTDPGLLEVLTGSLFGLELLGGRRPLFNPLGWDPQIGIDAALDLLGWSCQRSDGGDADAALTRLQRHHVPASAAGPGPQLTHERGDLGAGRGHRVNPVALAPLQVPSQAPGIGIDRPWRPAEISPDAQPLSCALMPRQDRPFVPSPGCRHPPQDPLSCRPTAISSCLASPVRPDCSLPEWALSLASSR
jgi:hypothetical protein